LKTQKLIPLLVVAAGLLAYHNSFTSPFIFDDIPSIQENPSIRHLWPIWDALSPPHKGGLTGRPLINLSLAVNYAIGGTEVQGYHALNLTIHILAGLTLFGIMRRTLLQPRLRERFGAVANELALAVAVIWTVHPLQTESVTYIIQRCESLMGLFYLLTLYCFIRAAESLRPRVWYGLCVSACALGMASKEVMASAPLMVLLYDQAFVSGSLRGPWRRRWPLYLALAATWGLLGYLLIFGRTFRNYSHIATSVGVTRWPYLLTEPGVILHYLRLAAWPDPLCFDYFGWPLSGSWASILPPALVMAILLGATAWAWKTDSAWGVLGAWFFLILAPSSSFIPTDSPAYEHRLYLPLAAVVAPVVMGIHALVGRRTIEVAVVLAFVLGVLTVQRNQDYRSNIAIWGDTVAKRRENPRAHYNLGVALEQAGRVQDAIGHYEQALRLKPDYAEAQYNLGVALVRLGRLPEAMGHWEQALRIKPDYAKAENNLAWLLATLAPADGGDPVRAVTLAERAGELTNNREAEYLDTLAVAYAAAGRFNDAITTAQKAIGLAHSAGQTQIASEIETRLELYRAGRAYHAPASVTGPHGP
jgi:Flp pilus assembly protein TadD